MGTKLPVVASSHGAVSSQLPRCVFRRCEHPERVEVFQQKQTLLLLWCFSQMWLPVSFLVPPLCLAREKTSADSNIQRYLVSNFRVG